MLELLARGLTNPEIAGVLQITRATVKTHVSAIIEALDVTNRTEAAMALRGLRLSDAEENADPVPGFGSRPAIAVLPFDNLSTDPEQALFADGLVEDLTTRLATVRWFPVIARNSAFAFRETPRDLTRISQALGARYLIEGSTRRAGNRARLHVQVIDGDSGHHVFAEKYDREMDDVFAVQDEIVDAIVGALEPALLQIESLRALGRAPAQLDTWQRLQRGMALFRQGTPEPVDAAVEVFEAVTADAPTFAPAHAALAMASYLQGLIQMGRTQFASTDRQGMQNALAQAGACYQRAASAGRRATELDGRDPNGWIGYGAGLGMTGDPESARGAFERAVDLNPSSALACFSLGNALMRFDDWHESIGLCERAIRLSPRDPNLASFEAALAGALLRAKRYEEALGWAQRSREHQTAGAISSRPLIPTCLSLLGRLDEARREVESIRRGRPDFNLNLIRMMAPSDVTDAIADAFAKAGWDLRQADPDG